MPFSVIQNKKYRVNVKLLIIQILKASRNNSCTHHSSNIVTLIIQLQFHHRPIQELIRWYVHSTTAHVII